MMKSDPKDIIEQLRRNLDLYPFEDGFTVLRELLQNADDAKASRVAIHLLPGWPEAKNPLLHGAGLLVVNDGMFDDESKTGMETFGGSAKAADNEAVGRFGLGQKSVFYLCDAFIVLPCGYNRAHDPFVINPFIALEQKGDGCVSWDKVLPDDAKILASHALPDVGNRGQLLLWFPLRRPDLQPKPESPGIVASNIKPDVLGGLADQWRLAILLASLRHIKQFDLQVSGGARVRLDRRGAKPLVGYEAPEGERSFGGEIKPVISSVGREKMGAQNFRADLRGSGSWPRTRNRLTDEEKPQKASPHGAVLLVHDPESDSRRLDIDWSVLLPVESAQHQIGLDNKAGRVHLVLHGCFFVDSGRKSIIGFNDAPKSESDEAATRRKWNEALRDDIVLPLVPVVLHDAFERNILTTNQLVAVVSALRGSDFGKKNAGALAARKCLIRALEPSASGDVACWKLVEAESSLRPLPAPDKRWQVAAVKLFPGFVDWANENGRDLNLVCGPEASLTPEPPCWRPGELAKILEKLEINAFCRTASANALADFLEVAVGNDDERKNAAAGPLLARFRLALQVQDKPSLAANGALHRVMSILPDHRVIALPRSAGKRDILRALASAPDDVPLCLREEWLVEDAAITGLSLKDAAPLFSKLKPLLEEKRSAEAASTAALALVSLMKECLTKAVAHSEIGQLPILRAGDGSGTPKRVSLEDLVSASRKQHLFKQGPSVQEKLKAVHAAVPETGALFVSNKVASQLEEIGEPFVFTGSPNEAFARIIGCAQKFGAPEARARLLDRIYTENHDARPALRALACGDRRAGDEQASLFTLPQTDGVLDDLVLRLIGKSATEFLEFLVPTAVARKLSQDHREHLGINLMDDARFGCWLDKKSRTLADMNLCNEEITALLNSDVPDEYLRKLPIFPDTDDDYYPAAKVYLETTNWKIPCKFAAVVPILKPPPDDKAAKRAKKLVAPWSPEAQIRVALDQPDRKALDQPEPHHFWEEILDALADWPKKDLGNLRDQLRQSEWLPGPRGQAWAPQDIVDLPDDVLKAARGLFDERPFLLLSDLACDLHDDPGFEALRSYGVLPDKSASIDALLRMVEDMEDMAPLARMGEVTGKGADALAALARQGADLGLRGWPLLAALLRQPDAEPVKLIKPFGLVSENHFQDAVVHMNALADLAEKKDAAAHAVYDLAFHAVCDWSTETMHDLFHKTRVPTEAKTWRFGREVTGLAAGLAPSYMLLERLRKQLPKSRSRESEDDHDGRTAAVSTDLSSKEARIKADADAAESLRILLDYAKSEVPPDLLILLVGLVRRTDAFRNMAREELNVLKSDITRIWKQFDLELEACFKGIEGETLLRRRDQRFLKFTPVSHQREVEVETLSGKTQALPVGDLLPLMVVGDPQHGKWEPVGGHLYRCTDIWIATPEATVTTDDVKTLCNTLAEELIGDHRDQAKCFEALSNLAESCDRIDQTTVETAKADLEDQLPHILDEIKPTQGTALWTARDQYDSEKRALVTPDERDSRLPKLKRKLWESIQAPEAKGQLLAAVRGRIGDYGYSSDRVLFELFQNADDASFQHPPPGQACFRLEVAKRRMRAVHWGRLINHPGPNARQGARKGWLRDLYNMLLMNLSEKREDVTGRFGLGFKSVHLIAAEVGIASGFVACRVEGGMLPEVWKEGRKVSSDQSVDGRRGTVIELLPDDDRADQAHAAVETFCKAARWLPAMSCRIRKIELSGPEPEQERIWVAEEPLRLAKGISLVKLSGAAPGQALTLELGEETTLFLLLSSAGPVSAEEGLYRLWLLAPLAEKLESGWLMNGRTFRVDPGRGSLKRDEGEPQDTFARLGVTLGERLIALADLVHDDWAIFASKSGLEDKSPETGPTKFWSMLSDLFALDLGDPLARHLHAPDRGYGRLISERAVLPTGLPPPFRSLLRAGDAGHVVTGALKDEKILANLCDWRVLDKIKDSTVSHATASQTSQSSELVVDPYDFFEKLYHWWEKKHSEEGKRHDRESYPGNFSPGSLRDKEVKDDREGWFTFFALGIFRTLGRTRGYQHRSFIEKAQQSGWWSDMATAKLPDKPAPWIARLEDFARADIDYPQWRRALADLYMLARWLPGYVDAFRKLPALVRKHERIKLKQVWMPSDSAYWQGAGLEGAPLTQSLGLGANWMIREAIRHGLWPEEDACLLYPYGWASTGRVRELFFKLGYDLGEKGNMDCSPEIFEVVSDHIEDDAIFLGDLDLPLQLWKRVLKD